MQELKRSLPYVMMHRCTTHYCVTPCSQNAMIFGTLQDLRRVSIEELKKVESSLDKESSEDAEMRDKYSSRWNRPASAALNSSMREKIAGYNANLTAAGDSDARLEQRLMQNNAAFSALSIDAAVSQMPRLQVRLYQQLLLTALCLQDSSFCWAPSAHMLV